MDLTVCLHSANEPRHSERIVHLWRMGKTLSRGKIIQAIGQR